MAKSIALVNTNWYTDRLSNTNNDVVATESYQAALEAAVAAGLKVPGGMRDYMERVEEALLRDHPGQTKRSKRRVREALAIVQEALGRSS